MRKLMVAVMMLCVFVQSEAQTQKKAKVEQCGTMPLLEKQLSARPGLREKYLQQRDQITERLNNPSSRLNNLRTNAAVVVPVVFHIVLPNPNIVTNAQILRQLDSLNKDYSSTNGSSANIPSWFQSIKGTSNIQFCLAQRTPDGEETNGINRVSTTVTVFDLDNRIKLTSQGGQDSWDTEKYLNVWVCAQDNGIIGYATFPTTTDPEFQGVVIDYRSLPGGSYAQYNGGKTLTHETGHFFGLYHIWGDDDGKCTGSDFVDDTPNQADATEGCKTGQFADSCSGPGNGINYQNYMDYSYDRCLMMFTKKQVERMDLVFNQYRLSLASSNGCVPPVVYDVDAWLTELISPEQRICDPAFVPVVKLKNRGNLTLTSVRFNIVIDNGAVINYQWTGNLLKGAETTVNIPEITAATGKHTLVIYTTNPNGTADQNTGNDTLRSVFQYYPPVDQVRESFENEPPVPAGWDIVNFDGGITWQRADLGKTGVHSMYINNFQYEQFPSRDDLRLPEFSLPGLDSAFLSFQVAAGVFSALSTANNNWDTLEVLISTDCGKTYTSVYKKWAETLVTRTTPSTTAFVPRSSEWRKDSINLQNYIDKGEILVAFRNTTGYENNVYLDDINLRKVIINPNLKAKGFLVTPNPARSSITVQFYPQPVNLRAVQLYSSTGQKVAEILTPDNPGVFYQFQTGGLVSGIYYVRAVFTDRVVINKVLKL